VERIIIKNKTLLVGAQGLAVIFSHHQVCVKRRRGTLFLLPKVKVEFRHLFSLQNRLSLFFSQGLAVTFSHHWKLTLILSPYKPQLSMIRSCPNCLEFKNECYFTVNQSISKKHHSSPFFWKFKIRVLFLEILLYFKDILTSHCIITMKHCV
jgi:hypothetical protein